MKNTLEEIRSRYDAAKAMSIIDVADLIEHAVEAGRPKKTLNDYASEAHKANAKWWVDLETGQPLKRNVGELLMLCTSELAEAMEGHRKNLQDDNLPHRKMFEVELADCVIRILDICAGMGLDLEGAYLEKMAYNASRVDHSIEHRKGMNGKKY